MWSSQPIGESRRLTRLFIVKTPEYHTSDVTCHTSHAGCVDKVILLISPSSTESITLTKKKKQSDINRSDITNPWVTMRSASPSSRSKRSKNKKTSSSPFRRKKTKNGHTGSPKYGLSPKQNRILETAGMTTAHMRTMMEMPVFKSPSRWSQVAPRSPKERRLLYETCGRQCFLLPDDENPGQSRFPVCPKIDPSFPSLSSSAQRRTVKSCGIDPQGLRSANKRAQQYYGDFPKFLKKIQKVQDAVEEKHAMEEEKAKPQSGLGSIPPSPNKTPGSTVIKKTTTTPMDKGSPVIRNAGSPRLLRQQSAKGTGSTKAISAGHRGRKPPQKRSPYSSRGKRSRGSNACKTTVVTRETTVCDETEDGDDSIEFDEDLEEDYSDVIPIPGGSNKDKKTFQASSASLSESDTDAESSYSSGSTLYSFTDDETIAGDEKEEGEEGEHISIMMAGSRKPRSFGVRKLSYSPGPAASSSSSSSVRKGKGKPRGNAGSGKTKRGRQSGNKGRTGSTKSRKTSPKKKTR